MPTLPPIDISDAELADLRADCLHISDMIRLLKYHNLSMADKLALRLLHAYDDALNQCDTVSQVNGLAGPNIG